MLGYGLGMLTLIEPGSSRTAKYRGPPRREFAQNGAVPNCPLRKSKRVGPTKNLPPLALYAVKGRKLTGILTGAAPDCRPQPGRTSSCPRLVCDSRKTERKGGGLVGWHRGQTYDEDLSQCI
jgi:hypothetical protein